MFSAVTSSFLFLFSYLVCDSLLKSINEGHKNTDDILEGLSDGIITIDKTRIIQTVNSSALKIFGYSKKELVGHNVKIIMPEPYRSEHDGYVRNYQETGEAQIIGVNRRKVEGITKDGRIIHISLGVNTIGENGFVGSLQDITKEVEQHEKIQSQNKILQTVAFIARHDLPNKIGGIQYGLFSLQKKLNEEVIKKLKLSTPLKILEMGTKEAVDILEGLRDWTDVIKAGIKLKTEDYYLGPSLEEYFKSKGLPIKVSFEKPFLISANKNLMLRVFENLVNNGIAYGKEPIRVFRTGKHIYVEDQGGKFKPELFEKMCNPFQRGDGDKPGTGLGMAIVKQICQAHGFEFGVEVKKDEWTRFFIKL